MAALNPLITFKAGRCEIDGRKVRAIQTPGYLYLYSEDDLVHLCWRPRSAPATDPEIDLITIPRDASFRPLVKEHGAEEVRSPTNGRIFCLTFSSSGEKHYFWMQAKTQHRGGDHDFFSARDQRIGQIVDQLLSGDDVDVQQEMNELRQSSGDDDEDTDLMDVDGQETGGAGPNAPDGDAREEGESNRGGGADGSRAAPSDQPQDTSAIVQNFLNSLSGNSAATSLSNQKPSGKQAPVLTELLHHTVVEDFISTTSHETLDSFCRLLPTDILVLWHEWGIDVTTSRPGPSTAEEAIQMLSVEQKIRLLDRVLRSPQMRHSLACLTFALRDGGLPVVAPAMQIKVANSGRIPGGNMPLGGDDAIEAFIKGLCETAEEENKGKDA